MKKRGAKAKYTVGLNAKIGDKNVRIIESPMYLNYKKANKIKEDVKPQHLGEFNKDKRWQSTLRNEMYQMYRSSGMSRSMQRTEL